jgi:DNA-binding transcriptional MerR regulator
MESGAMAIGELADAAGLTRRAIRFYVQQGLLPPPLGRGRGRHYDDSHLKALRRIAELQQAGHSLEAIRTILRRPRGAGVPQEPAAPPENGKAKPRAALSAELWTRLRLMEGVELHFDAAKFAPEVEGLLALRDLARDVFQRRDRDREDE